MKERDRDKVLSVHIEKAAGTTLQATLEEIFGRGQVLIYNGKTNSFKRASEFTLPRTDPRSEWIRNTLPKYPFIWKRFYYLWTVFTERSFRETNMPIDQLPDDYKVIHGHFRADQFDDQLYDPFTITVFREPLSRMWSQYQHWKRNHGVPYWRVDIPYDPQMTFEEYALHLDLKNYQTQALGAKDISGLDVVGVAQDMEDFTERLISTLVDRGLCSPQYQGTSPGTLNRSQNLLEYSGDQAFEAKFREWHKLDYELYQRLASKE